MSLNAKASLGIILVCAALSQPAAAANVAGSDVIRHNPLDVVAALLHRILGDQTVHRGGG